MGLGSNAHQRRTFLNIINGKIAQRADADTKGAVKRYSEKKQEDVYELLEDYLEGELAGLEIEKGKFGTQLNVLIRDADQIFQLQIPTESRYFNSFCDKVENLNLYVDLKIEPYNFQHKTEKNTKGEPKKIIGVSLYQSGSKILNFYSKDYQGDKPEYPKDANEKKMKRYYLDLEEYFTELIGKIGEKLPNKISAAKTESSVVAETDSVKNEDVDDGLPF